ncbi:hypothetical protein UlMin_018173 [Ulmus minor]
MMAGNPNWWSMHPPSFFPPQYVLGSSSVPLSYLEDQYDQPPPTQSLSQLLLASSTGLSGGGGEEDRLGLSHFQPKKLDNWEEQILNQPPRVPVGELKQEVSQKSNYYPQRVMPVSSPRSCVTSSLGSNNMLDFSYNKADGSNQNMDHSSECSSPATGGVVCKKARVQPSSSQPPLKVRKEKLGDRITALHQLVSPFGKTDTASVLLEAIGYIRFLQSQIEALSSPYMGHASKNMRNQHYVESQEKEKDLRSRGLCLVPVSCTQQVGSDNGADYWAPAYGSGL